MRLDLKLGFSCNNRCVFCVQGDKRARLPDLSTAEALREIEAGRAGCDELVLTGGEVTIRKDLPELVAAAKSLGYRRVQVQTNGRMLSRWNRLGRLVAAGLDELSPALHGACAETHDALTGVRGAFSQTVRAIRNARLVGLPVITNTVVVRGNLAELPALARLLVGLRVNRFQLAFVHPLGTAAMSFDEVVPRLPDVQGPVLAALAIGRAGGVPCSTEAVPLCFLPGFEGCAAEPTIPATRIVDGERVVDDYTETRVLHGKAKGPPCGECRLDAVCEGPWREYPERFGWDEFRPLGPSLSPAGAPVDADPRAASPPPRRAGAPDPGTAAGASGPDP